MDDPAPQESPFRSTLARLTRTTERLLDSIWHHAWVVTEDGLLHDPRGYRA